MKQKQLPFLPFHFFYLKFRPEIRRLFVLGLGVLIGIGGVLLFSYHNPTYWSLEIEEIAQSVGEEVTVTTFHNNYRSLAVPFTAFRQWITYTAGALQPHDFILNLFLWAQIFAWAIVFTFASAIRSKWSYLFYLMGALFIHFSGFAKLTLQGEEANLLEFGQILSVLGLAYLFQIHTLKANLIVRFLSFFSLLAAYAGLAYAFGKGMAPLTFATGTFGYLAIISIIFIIFLGKEPTNLLVLFGTNYPQRKQRIPPRLIVTGFVLLLLISFVWVNDYMDLNWIPAQSWGIKPIHFLLIASIFTVVTTQNQFPSVKFVFSSNFVFSLLLLAWVLISVSFICFCFSLGDFALVHTLERIAALSFFAIGLAHIFYIILNFKPLLFKKINFYYLMANGPRFSFFVVWLIGLSLFIIGEGVLSWRSAKVFTHSQVLQLADLQLAKGNVPAAKQYYEAASYGVKASNRAHYNLASILVADPNTLNDALDHYQKATAYFEFPFARINAATVLQLNGQQENATKILLRGWDEKGTNPWISNNLGMIYRSLDKPDSAIIAFKAALHADLGASSIYSNLANHYLEYDETEVAGDFFAASLEVPYPSTAANINAFYFGFIQENNDQKLNTLVAGGNDPYLNYTQALWEVKQGNFEQARMSLNPVLENPPMIEANILEGWLMFQEDSLEFARSRVDFISENQGDYASLASYMMGALYFDKGLPEMARKYFLQAGASGYPKGYLQAAKMELDLGMADVANERLSTLRIEEESLWEDCAKELAMILLAYGGGNTTFASTEWDISSLSREEKMRVGLYADSVNNYITALENFREVIGMDSGYVYPYLEMGKIYQKYGDDMVEAVVEDGLAIFPNNPYLQGLLCTYNLDRGNIQKANELLNSLSLEKDSIFYWKMQGAYALANKDTATALTHYLKAYEKQVLDTESIVILSKLFLAQGHLDLGNALISRAVNLNDENSDLWYWYAKYSREWGMQEDAGFAAAKAIELSVEESQQVFIAEEFATELNILQNEGR